jgi:polyferredoxin
MNPKTTSLRRVLLINFLVSGLLVGRAFCSWACPFGALQEIGSMFTIKLSRTNSPRRSLRIIKVFLVLFTFLIAFCPAYPILLSFLPQLLALSFILNSIYAISFTLNSLILTIPWIIGFLKAFIFIFFLGLSIFLRRTWCKICPLGTIISFFNKISLIKLKVNKDKCNECNRCSLICQMSLEPQYNGLRSIDCIRCLDCIYECEARAFIIEVKFKILKTFFFN